MVGDDKSNIIAVLTVQQSCPKRMNHRLEVVFIISLLVPDRLRICVWQCTFCTLFSSQTILILNCCFSYLKDRYIYFLMQL